MPTCSGPLVLPLVFHESREEGGGDQVAGAMAAANVANWLMGKVLIP